MSAELPTGLIGKAVKRKEDRRFLTGKGRYVDDIHRPGELWAVFVRSPHPHARVKGVDKDAALDAPGVVDVFTGADMARDNWGSIPCGWVVTDRDGEPHKAVPHYALTPDKARYVGDHVAMVIAETASQARDASELVDVDYEVLEANVDVSNAIQAAQMHDDAPNNLCYDWVLGDESEIDEVFEKAHHIAGLDLVNNRLIPNPMEPRAAIAEYGVATDGYTLWSTSQNPHMLRWMLSGAVDGHSRDEDQGYRSGRRWRLRHEDLLLSGRNRLPVGNEAGRASGALDSGTSRVLPRRCPCTGSRDPSGAGARRGGPIPRTEGRYDCQHGRVPFQLCDEHSHLFLRNAVGRDLQDAGHLLQRQGSLHEHVAGRRPTAERAVPKLPI